MRWSAADNHVSLMDQAGERILHWEGRFVDHGKVIRDPAIELLDHKDALD